MRPRHRSFHRLGIVCAALACGLAACGGGGSGGIGPLVTPTPSSSAGAGPTPLPGASATPTNPTAPNVVPNGAIYIGAFVNTSGTKPPPASDLTAFEAQIGRTVALSLHYYGFFDSFPGAAEAADASAGRIPIESWNCQYPNSAIAAGNQDKAIRQRADALKAFGKPIFVRYMWEMNSPSSSSSRSTCHGSTTDDANGFFSPSEFIAAWDRMRAIFAQEGASNVIWLWAPSGYDDPTPYYPGGSEVDWVAFDKYDTIGAPFSATYQPTYSYVTPFGKPIMISETGAPGSVQPSFFGAAVNSLETQYPLVKAYVYFDSVGAAGTWTLTTSGLSAFKTMANDQYFSAMPP